MGKKDFATMKFVDLSKEDRTDILDRVSTELNIRQREVIKKIGGLRQCFELCFAYHTLNICLSRVAHH